MNAKTTAAKQVCLSIDGTKVNVPEGSTILDAARKTGARIPTLCFLPELRPIGSCRVCMVEVDDNDRPTSACNTEALEGMQVVTRSERLFHLRREVIKMVLAQHPANCAPCPKNGDCALQDMAYEYDVNLVETAKYNIRSEEVPWKPYATPILDYYPNRCILCGRCVRICTDIRGLGAITMKSDGANSVIQPVFSDADANSRCISCGECMRVCPVNAIDERLAHRHGKPWETTKVQTTCPYCGTGCQMELNVVNDRVVGVTTNNEVGINHGRLCSKGRFGYHFVHSPDRLTQPLMRDENGELKETTWSAALDRVAQEFTRIKQEHGPQALGGMSSARCTNEDNYIFQRFMRQGLGTNNVDHCARL